MSVNSFFSLDRAVNIRSEEAGFVDPEPLQIVKPLPKNLSTSYGGHNCSLRTDIPVFFQSIFSSLSSGNEVSFIINDSDIIWNKTELIRD